MLPLPVLERAAAEFMSVGGSGQSVMEMSHRSKDFIPIIENAEHLIRKLMHIPHDYHVLFLQGGAWTQFAMVPINLAGVAAGAVYKKATYIDTGVWAGKAAAEAAKYVNVRIGASGACAIGEAGEPDAARETGTACEVSGVQGGGGHESYTAIPAAPPPRPDDVYYYICLNNTIMGTKWAALPETGAVPLVADISSCILSEPIDVTRYGILFAGAQKNLGPAGCTVVIVRNDLIKQVPAWTPAMLRYETHVKEKSLFNTPCCFGIYMIGLVLQWLEEQGGAEEMRRRNTEKAELLYNYLDASPVYYAPVEKNSRSRMNVRFGIRAASAEKKQEAEKRFVSGAEKAGLVNLAGHRLIGGLRASIYNAMPKEGVEALINFMDTFKINI